MEKVTLTCIACHKTETFKSHEQAFKEGWDCAPYFSYTSCPNCPIEAVVKVLEGKSSPYKKSDEISFAE